jgi:osmotically-inducible protein OsmY
MAAEFAFPPDQDLVGRLRDDLRALSPAIARRTAIEVRDGVVTLRGSVPTFHIRQLLVHCCQKVPGVTAVRDELKVRT